MKRSNKAVDGSVAPAEAALPSAGCAPRCENSSSNSGPATGASGRDSGVGCAVLSTANCEDAIVGVLHKALGTVQAGQSGPNLDALASALQRLWLVCEERVAHLSSVELEQSAHLLTDSFVRAELQRARTLADAVHSVATFVRGRALGELDQGELNESWLRLWDSVSLPSR